MLLIKFCFQEKFNYSSQYLLFEGVYGSFMAVESLIVAISSDVVVGSTVEAVSVLT